MSPWPATAEHWPRESTSRCMRAASSLYRCAASRQPPRGERRWRGETEWSQCEHARTHVCHLTGEPPEPRTCSITCAALTHPRAGDHCTDHRAAEPEPDPSPALTLARRARRGCHSSDHARGAGQAAAEGRRPRARLPSPRRAEAAHPPRCPSPSAVRVWTASRYRREGAARVHN